MDPPGRRDALLSEMAGEAAGVASWHEYTCYLRDRERGLRASALRHLSAFLDDAQHWDTKARFAYVEWLCRHLERRRDALGHAIPQPLAMNVVHPTLVAWTKAEPSNSLPHRWLGIFFGHGFWTRSLDQGGEPCVDILVHLRRAIELDPREQPARLMLIERLLAAVAYGTHHLPQFYIGEPAADVAALEEAKALSHGILDPRVQSALRERINASNALVDDWIAFRASADQDFGEWCRERGRPYQWVRSYYYDRG